AALVRGTDAPTANVGPISIFRAVEAFRQRHERNDTDRLLFGIRQLDRATRGVEPGELVIELGRTASLKSMFQQCHLRALVRARPNSAFLAISMEMPAAQWVRRMLRQDSHRSDEQLDAAIGNGQVHLEGFCQRYQNVYFVDQGAL